MAGNPLVAQGTLNRLQASVIFTSFPGLNITPAFLGEEMIGIALQGKSVTYINTATGAVSSPEPYMPVEVTANLLKTQSLAGQFKAQMETISLLGDCTVRPDSIALPPYSFINCSITGVRELRLNGKDAGYNISIEGYYLVNATLWDLTL